MITVKRNEFSCVSICIYCFLSFGWVLMRRIWLHLPYYQLQLFIHTDQIILNIPFSRLNTSSLSLIHQAIQALNNPHGVLLSLLQYIYLSCAGKSSGPSTPQLSRGEGSLPPTRLVLLLVFAVRAHYQLRVNTRIPPVPFHEFAL